MSKMLRWSEANHARWKAQEAAQRAPRLSPPIVGTANAQDRPTKRLRLTPSEAPESAVLDAVLTALRLHPRVAWCHRMNSGAGQFVRADGGKSQFMRFGFPGISDILGQLVDGRFLAVECKRVSGKTTDDQLAFLYRVRNNGGIAFVAYGVDDVMRELVCIDKT